MQKAKEKHKAVYDIRIKDITKPSPSDVEVDIDIEELEKLGQLQRAAWLLCWQPAQEMAIMLYFAW